MSYFKLKPRMNQHNTIECSGDTLVHAGNGPGLGYQNALFPTNLVILLCKEREMMTPGL